MQGSKAEEACNNVPVEHQGSRLERALVRRFPAWALLPLGAMLTVAVLLTAMLPIFYEFKRTVASQGIPYTYPAGRTVEDLKSSGTLVVELDLQDISPETHRTTFLVRLTLPAAYEQETTTGLAQLPDNQVLLVMIGPNAITLSSGDTVQETSLAFMMNTTKQLYTYPFDSYESSFTVRASIVNETIKSNLTGTPLDVYVVQYMGVQSYRSTTTLSPATTKTNQTSGVSLTISIQRTEAVKFFSMFIVLLLWFISLTVFVIAVSFVLSSSLEVSFEVPALCVGLLFALPFVREVQPDVPDVGAAIDLCGFFFNMILVALATIMVLVACSHRYYARMRIDQQRHKHGHHCTEP